MRQLFYYKIRQLLQNATFITNCDSAHMLKVTYNLKTMWTYMCIDVYVCVFVYIIYITIHENNCQIVLTKDSCRDKQRKSCSEKKCWIGIHFWWIVISNVNNRTLIYAYVSETHDANWLCIRPGLLLNVLITFNERPDLIWIEKSRNAKFLTSVTESNQHFKLTLLRR